MFDAAVSKAFGGSRRIAWFEVPAGEKAKEQIGEWLPNDTLEAVKAYKVAIKGPLTTPIGGGIRSLNVTLRQVLDLYACVRPVRYFKGTPAPVAPPRAMNMVIFRENTEDVYAGIEWAAGTPQAERVIEFLSTEMGKRIRARFGHRHQADLRDRHQAAGPHGDPVRDRQEAQERDAGAQGQHHEVHGRGVPGLGLRGRQGRVPRPDRHRGRGDGGRRRRDGKVLINDRIADSMFQQMLTRTAEYNVFATPNLNGDYLSDAVAAQVGGLGMAAGANIGDGIGMFEATHGTAPKYTGKDVINPSSVVLSGVMMFRYLGWAEAAAADRVRSREDHRAEEVTYDLARQMDGATELKTSQFADAVIENM